MYASLMRGCNAVRGRKRLIVLASSISILAGLFYRLGIGFRYQFLGMEAGSERAAVHYWGIISIGLGLTLFVTMVIRSKMNAQVNDGLLIMILALLFIIQLPPFALWLLAAIIGSFGAITGIVVHTALIAVIVRVITFGRRDGAGII